MPFFKGMTIKTKLSQPKREVTYPEALRSEVLQLKVQIADLRREKTEQERLLGEYVRSANEVKKDSGSQIAALTSDIAQKQDELTGVQDAITEANHNKNAVLLQIEEAKDALYAVNARIRDTKLDLQKEGILLKELQKRTEDAKRRHASVLDDVAKAEAVLSTRHNAMGELDARYEERVRIQDDREHAFNARLNELSEEMADLQKTVDNKKVEFRNLEGRILEINENIFRNEKLEQYNTKRSKELAEWEDEIKVNELALNQKRAAFQKKETALREAQIRVTS